MSKYAAQDRYQQANYSKVVFRIYKEHDNVLKELSDEYQISINKLIVNALEKTYGINLSKKDSK